MRLRAWLVLGVSVLWWSGCAGADSGGDHADYIAPPPELASALAPVRAFIQTEMAVKGLPAVSIIVVDDQTPIWAEGFGWERPADSVPASASTVYRVGSVSKLFTDLAVMQRVERGSMSLDAPIQDLLPTFSPRNPTETPITLRQLMSHRAGLVREPPAGHYFDDTSPSLTATVESLNDTELVYPPMERTKYSNAGIAVVGYALEEQDDEDFAGILQRDVLSPLGMHRSGFEPSAALESRLATSYMWTLDGREFEAPTFALGMAPAGSMYSTVVDLGLFMSALFAGGRGTGGQVVEAGTLEQMWTPQFQPPEVTEGGGLGFFIGELDGARTVRHGGAIYGFATELIAMPDERLGVVAVTSMDFANDVVGRIAEAALRAVRAARAGEPVPVPQSTLPLAPEMAEDLEGRYLDESGEWRFDLLERGQRLYLESATGGTRVGLRLRGDTLVVDDRLGSGGEWLVGEGGLNALDGRAFRRTPFPEPAPLPERWRDLVGEYGWDFDILYVLEKDGQLQALIEWFAQYPLTEEAPDRFRFPPRGLYDNETLVFERDDSGRVVCAVLAGAVVFDRRTVSGEDGTTFKIQPVRPVDALRAEALDAEPPAESGEFREPELVDVAALDPNVRLDVRYASTNNFMDARFYDAPRVFLQRPAAEALVRAGRVLNREGYGLLLHDGYRPWYVTKMFWDATPESQKLFVADPASGSRHNRGAAIDLNLYDLSTGQPVTMVSGYDEFSDRAFPDYPGGTDHQRWLRELLREAMEDEGFEVYEWEWWHFDYGEWRNYPILNLTFDQIEVVPGGP